MEIIQDYIPVTKAKSDFLELVRRLADSDETLAITKNGAPEVVLMEHEKVYGAHRNHRHPLR